MDRMKSWCGAMGFVLLLTACTAEPEGLSTDEVIQMVAECRAVADLGPGGCQRLVTNLATLFDENPDLLDVDCTTDYLRRQLYRIADSADLADSCGIPR